MSIVLAALDDSAAARCVVSAALSMARLLGAGVEAFHVHEDGSGATALGVANAAGLPLREARGDPTACIVDASGESDVVTVAVGSRGLPAGPRPAGHVALQVIRAVDKPVLVVSPAVLRVSAMERVLIPLDGTGSTTRALRKLLAPITEGHCPDLIAVHVLEPSSLPAFSDSAVYETEVWAEQFLQRFSPVDPEVLRLELRVGAPAEVVREVVAEVHADLVALGWGQDLSPGHARVVCELLRASSVPVLLLPVAQVRSFA